MTFSELLFLVRSDLYRRAGTVSARAFLRHYFIEPGFKYGFWLRVRQFVASRPLLRILFLPVMKLVMLQLGFKYGIMIAGVARIGPGFYICHFGGIWISNEAVIGRNVNISQDVTIGVTCRGKRQGAPVIGDNVYIGPGAKVIGRIRVGNNVAIGANSLVCRDVPDNAVVVGVPARIISMHGAAGYVNNTDYDVVLAPAKPDIVPQPVELMEKEGPAEAGR